MIQCISAAAVGSGTSEVTANLSAAALCTRLLRAAALLPYSTETTVAL